MTEVNYTHIPPFKHTFGYYSANKIIFIIIVFMQHFNHLIMQFLGPSPKGMKL